MKFLPMLIEGIFWMLIFLSPFLFFGIIAFFLYMSKTDFKILSVIVFATGILTGVLSAERVRKKYGCSAFFGKLFGTSEFEEKTGKEKWDE